MKIDAFVKMFVTQGLQATALLITVTMLAACGQKGPLYMPDENQDEQKQNEQKQNEQKQHNEQKQQKG
jgi:predicted small lipoprotein YifL